MSKKPLLVGGLDPGTTIGFALLDIDGKVVNLESSKQLSFSILIAKTVAAGRILAVGCDKQKVPELVERYSTKLGARIFAPDHDLLISEKKEIVSGVKTRNSHEFDAAASAIHALRQISPLLRRIRAFVKKYRKEHLFAEIASLVVKEGFGIRLAVDILERPDKEEVALARKAAAQETVPRQRILQLYEKLRREKDLSTTVRKENQRLQDELKRLRSLTDYLHNKIDRMGSEEKAEELLRLRQEQIVTLGNQIKAMGSEIEEIKKELAAERDLFSKSANKSIMKKLRNLGSQEFEKKRKFLNIGNDDTLFVEDPGVVSEEVLREIESMHVTLVVRNKLSDKISKELAVPIILAKDLQIEESRYFAFVNSTELQKAKSDISIIRKLVSDYQASRK
jgi:hypothetical protein